MSYLTDHRDDDSVTIGKESYSECVTDLNSQRQIETLLTTFEISVKKIAKIGLSLKPYHYKQI